MFIKHVRYISVGYDGERYRLYPGENWRKYVTHRRMWVQLDGEEELDIQLAYEEELESRAIEEADDETL